MLQKVPLHAHTHTQCIPDTIPVKPTRYNHTQVCSPTRNLSSARTEVVPLHFQIRGYLPLYSLQKQQFTSQEASLKLHGKGCIQQVPNQGLLKMIWPSSSLSVLLPSGLCKPTSSTQPTKESQIKLVDCQVTPDTLFLPLNSVPTV